MAESPDDVVSQLLARIGDPRFTERFAIERELGAGGMGRVFLATERATGRRIAVKLLDPLRHGDAVRFAAEAELLEQLDHPAIVAYVAHGVTEDDAPYLAMAWLDGETVAARLRRGPLAIADATALAARVTDALVHLHARGILHRDIKPSNVILVGGDPAAATVLDLGIAKQLGANAGPTATGELVGTPGYMAPEQVLGDRDLDGRVDLFALGCLLHEALTGDPPFRGVAVMEVLARLLLHDAPPVDRLRPEVPPRLARLIDALLAKRPADRLADAPLVAAELAVIARALADGDTAALATSPLPAPPAARDAAATLADRDPPAGAATVVGRKRPAAAPPRRRLLLGAAALAVLAAAAIAFTLTRPGRRPAPAPPPPAIADTPRGMPRDAPLTSTPITATTGTLIDEAGVDQLGVRPAAATWCRPRQRAIIVADDGRVIAVPRGGAATTSLGRIPLEPRALGDAVVVCLDDGRILGVLRGQAFVIDAAAPRAVDGLPPRVADLVARGTTARVAAVDGLWTWDGLGPARRVRRACAQPIRLAPDGERIVCRRAPTSTRPPPGDIQLFVDGPRPINGPIAARSDDDVAWSPDGTTVYFGRGVIRRWRPGRGADAEPISAGGDATPIGPWLMSNAGSRIHRAWIGRGRAPAGTPSSTEVAATAHVLAAIPEHGEVVLAIGDAAIAIVAPDADVAFPATRHHVEIRALAFDADGVRIASRDASGLVLVRSLAERIRRPHGSSIVSGATRWLQWRRDGSLLSIDGFLTIWDAAGDRVHDDRTATAQRWPLRPIEGSDDVAVTTTDGIRLLSAPAADGAWLLRTPLTPSAFRPAEVDRDRRYALVAGDKRARVYQLASARVVLDLALDLPDRVALIPADVPSVAVASSLRLYIAAGPTIRAIAAISVGQHLAAAPDGARLAVTDARELIVYDVARGTEILRASFPTSITAIAWDRTGRRLAAADQRTELRVFDVP